MPPSLDTLMYWIGQSAVVGGILRDVLCNEEPLVFQGTPLRHRRLGRGPHPHRPAGLGSRRTDRRPARGLRHLPAASGRHPLGHRPAAVHRQGDLSPACHCRRAVPLPVGAWSGRHNAVAGLSGLMQPRVPASLPGTWKHGRSVGVRGGAPGSGRKRGPRLSVKVQIRAICTAPSGPTPPCASRRCGSQHRPGPACRVSQSNS